MFALAFWAGTNVAWLMVVMVGFNLFFSPLVPLTDALANTGKTDNHGLRSGATVGIRGLVIGSALTGKLVSLFDYRVIPGPVIAWRRLNAAGHDDSPERAASG